MKIPVLSDGTKLLDDQRRAVILENIHKRSLEERSFRVMKKSEIPAEVKSLFPLAGTFYKGTLFTKEQEETILFLSPEGHYVVAVRTPTDAIGTVRGRYLEKIRDTFGYRTDHTGSHSPELLEYVKKLAKWMQGKLK